MLTEELEDAYDTVQWMLDVLPEHEFLIYQLLDILSKLIAKGD